MGTVLALRAVAAAGIALLAVAALPLAPNQSPSGLTVLDFPEMRHWVVDPATALG